MPRFAINAKSLTDRGIPVLPLERNSKAPAPFLAHGVKDASLDPAQIAAWDQMGSNYNVGAAADGSAWMLDVDNDEVLPALFADTGFSAFPATFTVRTARGFHFYWLQTDETRAMGNVIVKGQFEARVSGLYVVGPGSIHPSGKRYEVINDAPIAGAPAWLIDWLILKNSAVSPTKGTPGIANPSSVQDSLHYLLHWLGRHKIDTLGDPIRSSFGGVKLYVPCFQRHLHTTDSGPSESALLIGPDGVFAYRCQHSHCHDLTWERYRAHFEPTLTPERLALLTGTVAEPAAPAIKIKKPSPLAFDPAALYGPLGDLALKLRCPLGLVYPSLLAAYSVRCVGTPDLRTNHYVCLLGAVGGFKGESANRAFAALHTNVLRENVVSDRGVEKALAAVKGGRCLVYQDEFLSALKKMAIPNSTLAGTLCQLWSSSQAGTADKAGVHELHAVMSLIGNVPIVTPTDFRKAFPPETSLGLYDRCIFGRADDGEIPEYSRASELNLEDTPDILPVPCVLQSERWVQMREWVVEKETEFPSLGRQSRLGEILLRVAGTLGASNGEQMLSDGAFEAAKAFCGWQLRLRQHFSPSKAINLGGQINEAILASLIEKPGAWPRSRLLTKIKRELGCSARDFMGEINAMVNAGELAIDDEQNVWIMEVEHA